MNPSCVDSGEPGVDAGARVFGEGDRLYAAMLADIAAAQRHIRLESYIFASDAVGWRFAEALAERARAGVVVQVHVDSAGALWQGTARLFRYLDDHGVDTRWFHRWRWRRPWRYNRRNHRKLLVVDGATVYVGGFNLHRESSQAVYGDRRWRDVHVRIASALGADAARLFDELWHARRRTMAPPWRGALRLVPNANGHCRRELHCLYLDALRGAERSIDIVTPYFVPDHHLREALAAAARRGVAVRVLLPARSDNLLTELAARALAGPLLAAGVRFFEYLPRMLHGKLMLVDDCWATVGSANVDYRSFFINQELNLVCREASVCARLARLAAADFAASRRLSPSASDSLGPRALAQWISRRLRRWL
ncbi:MAG: phospholipase D-like domain-containing protein [Pseudomonadales bacterium]